MTVIATIVGGIPRLLLPVRRSAEGAEVTGVGRSTFRVDLKVERAHLGAITLHQYMGEPPGDRRSVACPKGSNRRGVPRTVNVSALFPP